ncbi:hypothetical protein LXA43DRAFT_1059213 [Ganoderma leucocontextum]|nr:hypothetical protein LXA43DRAFT_1059213 [Ganoderma leucocontextum]
MSYDPQVVAYFDNFLTNEKCAFAALTLLAYEYVFNLHREAGLFWKRKLSGASVLFFFARYTPILAYALADMQFAPMSDTSCSVMVYASLVLSGLHILSSTGPRTKRKKLAISRFRGLQPFNDDVTGCGYLIYGFPPDLVHKLAVTVVSRLSLILADLLVAIVTWWSTYRTTKLARGLKGFEQNALSSVMLRDGSIYFVVLVVLNLLHLIFTTMNVAVSRSFGSFIPLFTEPLIEVIRLTGVLVIRFLLNLQEANRRTTHSQSSPSQLMGNHTLQFAGVLDSLSGPLAIGEDRSRHHDDPTMMHDQSNEPTGGEMKLDVETGRRESNDTV